MRAGEPIFGACVTGMLLVCTTCGAAHAQNPQSGSLPEVDLYYEFNPDARLYVQAKDERDGGDPTQFAFGPSVQFSRKPLLKLKRVLVFDLDKTKSRLMVMESGYRVIAAPGAPVENRLIEAVTFNFPLLARFVISDRNRFDLDWQNGEFTWRYRNKLSLERTFSIRSYHFAPYVAAEPFYESQYGKWSSTDLYAGSAFPIGKHVELDGYYEHENDTGKSPNKQKNYLGLKLQIYLMREKKANSQR